MPTVSVIIATHNRTRQLARAVASVHAQSLQDYELLVVDDASPPAAAASIAGLLDARGRLLRQPERRGASAARNRGLEQARGALVAFLDDDDEWLPRKLELQVARLRELPESVAGVYTAAVKVLEQSGEVVATVPARPLRRGTLDFLASTVFATSVPLLRTQAVRGVGGFDESMPGTQDRDLWIRLSRDHRFEALPDILVRHYLHEHQLTANLPVKIAARERLLVKYERDYAANPAVLAVQRWRLGMLCCANDEHHRGRRHLLAAIRIRPGLPGPYRELLQSLLMPRAHGRWLRQQTFRGAGGIPAYY